MTIIKKPHLIGIIILLLIFVLIAITIYRQHLHDSASHEVSIPHTPTVPDNELHEVDILLNQSLDVKNTTPPKPIEAKNQGIKKIHTYLENPLPKAWVIQLATFSSAKNAQTLLEKLRNLGYDAYSQSSSIKGKQLTRVLVGPNISYQIVQDLQLKLEGRYHLHGIIQPYHVKTLS